MRLALILSALLTACAHPLVFRANDGTMQGNFDRDQGECMVQANMVPLARARTVHIYCMQGKGWSVVS